MSDKGITQMLKNAHLNVPYILETSCLYLMAGGTAVLNLDDGMSVALTQNYVSRSNLPDVLRFLKMKPQQISGCRDRPEAIQPEDLLHAFTSRLQQCRPDLLLVAQSLADTKWQCAAWGDDNEEEQTQEKQSPHNKKKLKTLSQSIVQQAKSNNATNSDNQTRKD
eukprot:CAMPEP_0203639112 /NCGR_PEP_ID=MMETSP0088-20131115/4950_1 /ASSEMBLY_ACC=CAM_ASM_001087 /TAXON_ID=426623 /ORGANISM="Chaetoceros affinis, Strain CCMP159" /LENGTH=164 /DNA_ID=CAMNT_0050493915 /DNA_START=81 /DNA_END=571 /DNA_ORIENTATION=+